MTNQSNNKCFACGRKVSGSPKVVDTRDDQAVYVGSECFKLVVASGEQGYQPPQGGPRLWVMQPDRLDYFKKEGLL